MRSSSPVGKPGSSTVAAPVDVVGEEGLVEVVAVEVGDVEVVGPLDRGRSSAGSWSLRGNTNHEPKNAGTNHGSHRIEPWSVSIRMPAWPIDVARIGLDAVGRSAPRATGPDGRP